jgi:raffinose/stachyose/melibiose transport system substrate-binding protein
MWALSDQTILKDSVDAYNKDHPDEKITLAEGRPLPAPLR